MWWYFVEALSLLLWVTKSCSATESTVLESIAKGFRSEFEAAAEEVLNSYVSDTLDVPPVFKMPDNFMHAFRPDSGVGNREDLIIKQVRESQVYDDDVFSKWRYFRFNNSDYLLGTNNTHGVLWKKSIDAVEYLVLSVHEGIFSYSTEGKGEISDSLIFTRRVHYMDILYVAILTEDESSFISIYEIIDEKAQMVTVIDLGFSTKGVNWQSSSKITDVQSRHGASLIVLDSGVVAPGIVYQQKGNSLLNHYIEMRFPEAVDMVSYTIGGHAYVAVANKTVCKVFKMIEFDKKLIVFETLRSSADIVDLEYFRLGFHHYLAVVAENIQTLYIWKRSGMFEKQSFQSMGVSQAYGILLPNCRDDVILMFVKISSSPELFVWNGQSENFISVTVDIPDSFRPVPGTIASYSYSATAYILFFDTLKFPKLFAIDTYLSAVNDPVLIFGKEVSDLMQSLQEKLSKREIEVREMSSALANAVRLSGNQQFSALQTFINLQSTKSISAAPEKRPLSIEWNGSPITLEDYLTDTKGLELKMDALETMIQKLESLLPDIVQVDEPAVITGQKIFIGDVSGSSIIARSLNIDYAAGVNIREVQKELYRLDKPATIQGTLTFSKPLHITGNLDVIGTVGGIDISKDVLTTNTEQESNAEMLFSKKLEIKGDLSLTGKLNGIDISNELVTLDGNHVVTGNKTFLGGIVADVVQADFIDGVNVNRLLTKSLRKSGNQLINGTKYFTGIVQTGDIALRGTINSHNLNELAASVVRTDQPSSISGHTTFMEDVIITDALVVAGVMNGLKIPDDLFIKNKSNIVTGTKTFSGIVAIGDVTVDGTVNGIKLPQDIITLSKDEIINGTLHFQNGISVERDIIVNGLVDGVDLSQLADDALQINETNAIKNAVFMGEVTIAGDILVQGTVNNVSLNDLVADIVYKNEKNVVIRGEKSFTKVIADKIELNGLINGYDIEHDFMTVAGEQTISGTKIFENSVVFQSLTTEDGIVDGVNLTQIYNNRVTLSIDGQVVDGNMDFVDHVIVDGDLIIQDSLGGYDFPGDFVLTSTDQEMSNKEFTGSLIVDNLIVSGDVEIQGTLNGIKLSEFLDERVTLTGNEDIYGDLILGDTTAEVVTISGLVNGLNIVDFANNVMSLTKNQTVTEYKEFLGESKVLGSVTTEEGINGIKLRDLNEQAFKLSDDMSISVPVTFSDPVFFENLNVRGLVNDVNLTKLNADSVKNVGFQYILGETTFNKGFHVEGDIKTNSVNGMNLAEDFLTRSTDQVIKGNYVFNDLTIEGDLKVYGSVNGIDLDKVAPLLVQRQKISTIHSDLIFKEPVHVSGDIDVSGFVNGMNLKEVEESALLKSGSQHIQGHKTLKGNVTIYGDVNVTFVNDVHWGEFLEDVVRIDVPRIISSRKVWSSDMEVRGDVFVSGFADIGLINDVNLTKFVDEAVFINRPAHITGTKIFSNAVEIAGDLNADLINGLDLQKDVIILQCTQNKSQIISGEKVFHNLTVYGDIVVDGYVNGHKLKDLVSNTLSVDGNQTITGHKRFHKEVTFLKDVHAPTVNGLSLSKDLVTLDTEQVIEGDVVFTGDVRIQKNLMVSGPINDVNLRELAEDTLYVDVEQNVDGAYTIENAVAKSDVFVDGLINGFDLHAFSQNVTDFWQISRSDFKHLMEKSNSYCEMVERMYSYLQRSYYILDGFLLHQVLSFPSDYADGDLKTGELNLVKVRSSDSIADAQKYLNSATGLFDHIQTQKVNVVKQKRYVFSGRELLITFGVSPRDSIVYYDGITLPAITHGFTDGDVVLQNGRAIVVLLYAKRSICEIFEIVNRDDFSFDVRPFGNIASEATSIALFDISGVTYLALAYDSAPAYKRNSEVYAYLKRDWQLVQNIPAAGSSRVLHFNFHDYHYLVFVNNVPTYKTKEPMAVQVYRNTDAEAVPFGLFQKLPFDDAKMLEIFKFGDLEELYLVVASELQVKVFRLEGESGFATTFVLYGKCISFVKPFLIGNELYLLVSDKDQESMKNVSTVIYKGMTQGWRIPSRKFEHCS